MKRIMPQVFISVVALLVAGIMVTSVSYAWMVLSAAPETQGITVGIGGGTTILVAPDVTGIDDFGNTYHRPGEFTATLNLSENDAYQEISRSGNLLPVSTLDGLHWYTMAYDQYGDPAGFAEAENGWLVLDLWLVSPGAEYDVRVSTDKNSLKGSYLVELPDVIEAEASEGETFPYALGETSGLFASTARVGFLANTQSALDQDMRDYMNSADYDNRYWKLQGRYDSEADAASTTFTIYEPNGTLHSGELDGTYLETQPITRVEDTLTPSAIPAGHLAVQQTSEINVALLEAPLVAALDDKKYTPDQAKDELYRDYLQGQLDSYLHTGLFYKSVSDLPRGTAGAAEDAVIVTLHKNVPQRIRVFLWLEGQDPDCRATGQIKAADLALKIELAGATK